MRGRLQDPLVSVIIPTYNRAAMVTEAVESVLSQNFEGMEVIVVDDGSTDDTPGRLAALSDRITVLIQKNRGVSAARNAGVARSSGRFISFLDSDDLWLPGKLAHQIDFLLNCKPQALICQTEELWVRRGRRVNPRLKHQKPSGWIFTPSLSLCLVSPSAVMMQRELFEAMGGFDEQLPACEDYDLWLRIACRHPIYLIQTPLIVKRGGHPDQLSAQPCLDRYRIRSLSGVLKTCPLTASEREMTRRTLIEKCRIYANGCLKRGKTAEAEAFLSLAEAFQTEKTAN